ncbi:hypothetical protein FOA52_014652 [Chlamydomonas sp. UWO 241]|nr:hypothetical protein FOA52_014652 [Chlamydomonas sp. UWO 241]
MQARVVVKTSRSSGGLAAPSRGVGRRWGVAARAGEGDVDRRMLLASLVLLPAALRSSPAGAAAEAAGPPKMRLLDTVTPMSAISDKDYGKKRIQYPDFVATQSGLQYKDFRDGAGEGAKAGDTIVMDWDGYTIGYYGRPFEARNKPKGSSFTGENKDFIRFVLGDGSMIPAVEEAILGMRAGGIRRIIVPEELGYPSAPGSDWRGVGPKPSTFAGDRALGFVLENRGMIDKTLLIDVEVMKILRK